MVDSESFVLNEDNEVYGFIEDYMVSIHIHKYTHTCIGATISIKITKYMDL